MRNLFQIKVCGITRPEDAIAAINSNADAIGLNFYRSSPRSVDAVQAETIVERVGRQENRPILVGVFVNESTKRIAELVETIGLDAVQLHGDETPEILSELRSVLANVPGKNQTVRVIRAVRTGPKGRFDPDRDLNRVESEIRDWQRVGVDAILLDAAATTAYGGTGEQLDWEFVPSLSRDLPLVLAGGLNPENVESAIRLSRVQSVDVASGVESEPGCKDEELIRAFVAAARRGLGAIG